MSTDTFHGVAVEWNERCATCGHRATDHWNDEDHEPVDRLIGECAVSVCGKDGHACWLGAVKPEVIECRLCHHGWDHHQPKDESRTNCVLEGCHCVAFEIRLPPRRDTK